MSTVCPGVAMSGSMPGTVLSGPGSQLIAHCCLHRHRTQPRRERDIPLGCTGMSGWDDPGVGREGVGEGRAGGHTPVLCTQC